MLQMIFKSKNRNLTQDVQKNFYLAIMVAERIFMARILENKKGRRSVLLTEEDVLSVVREYQNLTCGLKSYDDVKNVIRENNFYLPEDLT